MIPFMELVKDIDRKIDSGSKVKFPSITKQVGTIREIIKITKKSITFTEGKSFKNINIIKMEQCYNILYEDLTKGNELLRRIFKDCRYTFFLQFLIYFNLINYIGKGVNGSPFIITKMK